MLKQIARSGHVYQHSATIQDLVKTKGELSVRLIGVNDASVLRVFCKTHDGPAFAPLEQAPFTASPQQCFLLGYRAICHELFRKHATINIVDAAKSLDTGKPLEAQMGIQALLRAQQDGYKLSLRDMEEHKQRFDAIVTADDYSLIRAFIVTLDTVPDILCAGAIYPEVDFMGVPLQNLANYAQKLEMMTFSLIATDTGGAFVFAWHSSSDSVCRPLAASLNELASSELPHAIVRFVFEFCENHYMNPDWWDDTDQDIKAALTSRLRTSASTWKTRSSTCLADDAVRAVPWNVAAKKWL
jgi:hypothetical protein